MKKKLNLDAIKKRIKGIKSIKDISTKELLYGVGVLVVLVAVIVTIVIISNNNANTIKYNEKKDIYEIDNGKIVIEDDFEISYNVVSKEYKISGTITNKTKKDYKDLELTFEFYNQEKELIDSTTKTVKEIKAKEKTNMEFTIEDTSVLIYDYKIVDVKTK